MLTPPMLKIVLIICWKYKGLLTTISNNMIWTLWLRGHTICLEKKYNRKIWLIQRYQNLWIVFVAQTFLGEESNDKALVTFSKMLKIDTNQTPFGWSIAVWVSLRNIELIWKDSLDSTSTWRMKFSCTSPKNQKYLMLPRPTRS